MLYDKLKEQTKPQGFYLQDARRFYYAFIPHVIERARLFVRRYALRYGPVVPGTRRPELARHRNRGRPNALAACPERRFLRQESTP